MAASSWAATESSGGLERGAAIPQFKLTDVASGTEFSPDDFRDKKALMVVFMCRHCPYVQHVKKVLGSIARGYEKKDVAVVGIVSNDAEAYPADAPESMAEMVSEEGFAFPVLHDPTQSVAKAFGAKATPETFIFDKDQKLAYHGQFDDSRPNSGKEATGADVRAALDALVAGEKPAENQKPAVGCSIKWKA